MFMVSPLFVILFTKILLNVGFFIAVTHELTLEFLQVIP